MEKVVSKLFNKYNNIFFILIAIYLISFFFLVKYYQYFLYPDSTAYISIAKQYLLGNFNNAVNEFWSPLYSWLIAFILKFTGFSPLNGLWAGRIINCFTGVLLFISVKKLSSKVGLNEKMSILVVITLIPLVLYVCLVHVLADLLMMTILLFYFNIIFRKDYSSKLSYGVLCGFICGLAFLSKAYALIFFLLHFSIFTFLQWKISNSSENRKRVFKNFLLGVLMFFIVSGLWIGMISIHAGKFTYGTSGDHNFRQAGPESTGNCIDNPGFMEPTYDGAFSVWDDPGKGSNLKSWSPFESKEYFMFWLKNIYNNIDEYMGFINSFSCFAFIILLSCFLLLISPVKDYILKRRNILFLSLTLFLFPLAYFLLRIESRYIRIAYVLVLLLGFCIMQMFFKKDVFSKYAKGILTLTLMISFMLYPVPFALDAYSVNEGKITATYNQLEPYHLKGNIVANSIDKVMLISFLLDTKYYGIVNGNWSDQQLIDQLKTYKIDYFVFKEGSDKKIGVLEENFPEITNGSIKGLKIFKTS
ncbi:MAG: conserved hypothetical protein [Methanobrevibacter sp. CfCl-M3]